MSFWSTKALELGEREDLVEAPLELLRVSAIGVPFIRMLSRAR